MNIGLLVIDDENWFCMLKNQARRLCIFRSRI